MVVLLTVFALSTASVSGQDGSAGGLAYTPPSATGALDPGNLLLRLIGMTAGLLTLCAVVIWLTRRANRLTVSATKNDGRLRHEGTLALDRRSGLHMIWADGQTVAVTTDASGLRSIVVLTEPFDQVLDAVSTQDSRQGEHDALKIAK
jgi:hypothetical protein